MFTEDSVIGNVMSRQQGHQKRRPENSSNIIHSKTLVNSYLEAGNSGIRAGTTTPSAAILSRCGVG